MPVPEIDGECDRLAQAERVELDGLLPPRWIVGFVRAQHDWLARAAQQIGDLGVGLGDAVARSTSNTITSASSMASCACDLMRAVMSSLAPSSSPPVSMSGEDAPVPLGVGVETVACGAGQVLDDGEALADELIEQGGFAHVGAAHDGDERFHDDTAHFLLTGG